MTKICSDLRGLLGAHILVKLLLTHQISREQVSTSESARPHGRHISRSCEVEHNCFILSDNMWFCDIYNTALLKGEKRDQLKIPPPQLALIVPVPPLPPFPVLLVGCFGNAAQA